MPVSVTVSARVTVLSSVASARARTAIPPTSVNLAALPIRLSRIWRRRVASASNASGVPASISMVRPRAFFSSWADRASAVLEIKVRSENGASSSSMRPASILEKSRTSSMMRISVAADPLTVLTMRFWRSVSASRASSSAVPTTPFIGVRISWLMVARKVDLAWLAASASSRAALATSRSLRSSLWRWRSSLMSVNSDTQPPDLVRAAVRRVQAFGPTGNSSAPSPRRCCSTIVLARRSTSSTGTGRSSSSYCARIAPRAAASSVVPGATMAGMLRLTAR